MSISMETENRLLAAAETAARHHADGLEPNVALAKAANEHGVRRGELDVLVRAFNVGQTSLKRGSHDNVFERAEDFELADGEALHRTMYPDKIASPVAVRQSTSVSETYKYAPRPKPKSRAMTSKCASIGGLPKPEEREVPDEFLYARQHGDVERLKTALEESRREATMAGMRLTDATEKLANSFRDPLSPPLTVVRKHAAQLHGEIGQQLMAIIDGHYPRLHKVAAVAVPGRNYAATGRTYELLDHAVDLVYKLAEASRQYQAMQTKYAEGLRDLIEPRMPEASRSIVSGRAIGDLKLAAGTVSTVGTTLGVSQLLPRAASSVGASAFPDKDKAVAGLLDEITDPDHEATLRNIRTESTLQDIMLNDQVIGGYAPEDVADAFNEVTQLSPHSVDQRGMLVPLLRKRLAQGHLDQFDAGSLLDSESKLRTMSRSDHSRTGAG